jgi:hypothetical protein
MTIRDFMNYLIYIEHAAENLQFFLWHRDYVKRFEGATITDMALAPEWTQAMEDETLAKIQKEAAEKMKAEPKAAEIFKGTDFEKAVIEREIGSKDPFASPPRTPGSNDGTSTEYTYDTTTHRSQANEAFTAAGAKQPCKSCHYTEEKESAT